MQHCCGDNCHLIDLFEGITLHAVSLRGQLSSDWLLGDKEQTGRKNLSHITHSMLSVNRLLDCSKPLPPIDFSRVGFELLWAAKQQNLSTTLVGRGF